MLLEKEFVAPALAGMISPQQKLPHEGGTTNFRFLDTYWDGFYTHLPAGKFVARISRLRKKKLDSIAFLNCRSNRLRVHHMNAAQLTLDNIERFGEYTSTWFEGRSYTNVELYQYACRFAETLRQHGVKPGDGVMVMMLNSPSVTAAFIAIWKLGAVIIPVTPMWNAREVRYVLEDSGAKIATTVRPADCVAPKHNPASAPTNKYTSSLAQGLFVSILINCAIVGV